jgi:subtilisin family serine protease
MMPHRVLTFLTVALCAIALLAGHPARANESEGGGIGIVIDVTKILELKKKKKPAGVTKKKTIKKPPAKATSKKPSASKKVSEHAPPPGETRFRRSEVLFVIVPGAPTETLSNIIQAQNLSRIAEADIALFDRRVHRYAITDGRSVAQVVTALESDQRIEIAQPNYLYELMQTAGSPATPAVDQYANNLIGLSKAHDVATGKNVTVALIDSLVDKTHPALAGGIADAFVSVDMPAEKPDSHGTAMAGAIAARGLLTGAAPAATLLAVEVFSRDEFGKTNGVTFHLLKGVDWAHGKGARIQNLSFAGPADPLFSRLMKAALAEGSIFVAAAGNAGAKSPPLYPAADESAIGITALDAKRAVYQKANRGKYILVAAPGVDVLALAPEGQTTLSTGTSIATASVSGLLALAVERAGTLDRAATISLLKKSAEKLKAPATDVGFGLVNAPSLVEDAGKLKQGAAN